MNNMKSNGEKRGVLFEMLRLISGLPLSNAPEDYGTALDKLKECGALAKAWFGWDYLALESALFPRMRPEDARSAREGHIAWWPRFIMVPTAHPSIRPEVLSAFCYSESDEKDIELHDKKRLAAIGAPFRFAGHPCATDGRIIVFVDPRVPGFEHITAEPKINPKTLFDIAVRGPSLAFKPHLRLSDIALPDIVTYPCGACRGSKHSMECPQCGGSGMFDCPTCHQNDTCQRCDGVGYIPLNRVPPGSAVPPCERCGGSGIRHNDQCQRINLSKLQTDSMGCAPDVDARLLRLLSLLADSPDKIIITPGPTELDMLIAAFPGGRAALMPLRPQ